MATFGEKLRQQREERGISLDAISKITKISTRLLRALEEERFDQLPGGVFNKGFVRAYARQVGLNEEETLCDYLDALRESQIQDQKILPDLPSASAKRSSASMDTEAGNAHARGNGTSAVGATERRLESRRTSDRRTNDRRIENRRLEGRPAASPANEVPLQHQHRVENSSANHGSTGEDNALREPYRDHAAELEAFLSPASLTPADRPAAETSAPGSEPSTPLSPKLIAAVVVLLVVILAVWASRRRAQPAPSQTATAANQSSPSASAPALPSLPVPAPEQTPGESSRAIQPATPKTSAAVPTTVKSAAHPSAVQPPKPFTVIIRADETTPISVLADGESVIQETLIAPAATSVRASHDVIVKAENGAAVSFLLDGKLIQPQGHEGEAKTYVLNAGGLVAAPQSQSPASNP